MDEKSPEQVIIDAQRAEIEQLTKALDQANKSQDLYYRKWQKREQEINDVADDIRGGLPGTVDGEMKDFMLKVMRLLNETVTETKRVVVWTSWSGDVEVPIGTEDWQIYVNHPAGTPDLEGVQDYDLREYESGIDFD